MDARAPQHALVAVQHEHVVDHFVRATRVDWREAIRDANPVAVDVDARHHGVAIDLPRIRPVDVRGVVQVERPSRRHAIAARSAPRDRQRAGGIRAAVERIRARVDHVVVDPLRPSVGGSRRDMPSPRNRGAARQDLVVVHVDMVRVGRDLDRVVAHADEGRVGDLQRRCSVGRVDPVEAIAQRAVIDRHAREGAFELKGRTLHQVGRRTKGRFLDVAARDPWRESAVASNVAEREIVVAAAREHCVAPSIEFAVLHRDVGDARSEFEPILGSADIDAAHIDVAAARRKSQRRAGREDAQRELARVIGARVRLSGRDLHARRLHARIDHARRCVVEHAGAAVVDPAWIEVLVL